MNKKVFIFGAGMNGKELLHYVEGVVAFIDNDELKQKTYICGLECISVSEAANRGANENGIILVSVCRSDEVEKQLKEYNFKHVHWCLDWLRERMYFKPVIMNETDYSSVVPFNSYESPYPDIVEIHNNEKELFDRNKEVLDVDFNLDRQLALLEEMERIELPGWPSEKDISIQTRYHYNNGWFEKGGADALYYMIRIIKPKTIIEVGSGYSTAVMLDVNELFMDNMIKIISVEPNADRLKSLLKPTDNIEIYENKVQEIPMGLIENLKENDILFIDSSHVSRMGSDVNYLLFEVLPRLKKGVYIHFHDIMYPFIYPKEWIYEGRAYNEMYILRAFLMNNKEYSIQLFGDMLCQKYSEKISVRLKECGMGSLWIKKDS